METALVDSNILLRLVQPAHAQYSAAAKAIASLFAQDTDLCIVTQNLVEFWVVATRPVANNGLEMTPSAVADEIQRLRSIFRLLEGGPNMADSWQTLVRQHQVIGKQAHDAHLVAAMRVYRLQQIVTFNEENFKRFPGITVLNPSHV